MRPATVTRLEPFLDIRGLADYFACSPRWVEQRIAEGMPAPIIAGKRKMRASEAERWLDKEGYIAWESE